MGSDKYKIEPNTVQETLTLPLYGRAYCSRKWPSVFPDTLSEEVVGRIDYDFEAMDATLKDFQTITWGLRQRVLADLAAAYLREHPNATVVDLGCGLSTARTQVDNGTCRFLNIDLPDVIEMRDAVLPAGERERNLAHDAYDLAWFDAVERPEDGVFVMCGGVMMYFPAGQNKRLVCGLAERFPNGGICFDAENEAGMRKSNKVVEKQGNTGAPIVFAVGDASAELGPWSPNFARISVVDRLPGYLAHAREVSWPTRLILGMGARMGMVKFVEIRFGGSVA